MMAGKVRDFSRSLAGIGAAVRSKHIRLRELPRIAEIERMLVASGLQVAWSAEFETKKDEASRALFGVVEAETRPKEPHPDDIHDKEGSIFRFSDAAWDSYNQALNAWYDWNTTVAAFEAGMRQHGAIYFFQRLDIDVTDGAGSELRCLPFFARQIYAAAKQLLPNARLTPNGEGTKRVQSVNEWAAALEAEAARFRPSR